MMSQEGYLFHPRNRKVSVLVSSVPSLENIRSFVTSKNMTQKAKWEAVKY